MKQFMPPLFGAFVMITVSCLTTSSTAQAETSSLNGLVAVYNRLTTENLEKTDVASALAKEIAAVFSPSTHGNYPVQVSGPVTLGDGTAVSSIEITRQPGVLSRVVFSLPETPCLDAKALSRTLHATSVRSGGIPAPSPVGEPGPKRTFYTGSYEGSVNAHTIRIGFKHWAPSDDTCVSSLSVEQ